MRETFDYFVLCLENPTTPPVAPEAQPTPHTPHRHQQLQPLTQHQPGQLLKLSLHFNPTPEQAEPELEDPLRIWGAQVGV